MGNIARKRLRVGDEPLPNRDRLFIPPDDIRNRCRSCGKDTSVQWVICALAQMYAEEKYHVYQFLRNDQVLFDYREMKRKRKARRQR